MGGVLYYGDNLDILKNYIKNDSIDLIYLDPPFNSNATYNMIFPEATGKLSKSQAQAFTDFWTWDEEAQKTFEYLSTDPAVPEKVSNLIQAFYKFLGTNDMSAYIVMMSVRLIELYRVLKPTGTLYLHCDPTASHYIKLILDAIFSDKNFRNEIIWCYRGAGYPKKDFGWRHDTIFRYSKTKDYVFNLDAVREEYAETTKERFRHYIGNVRASGDFGLQKLNPKGKQPDDWWEIQPIAPSARERLGYPTQKPLALLEKIIKASSNKGDIVLDPFCGCGTTIDASERLGREWIGIDITHLAIDVIKRRMYDKYGSSVKIKVIGAPEDFTGAKNLADANKYEFQLWALGLIGARPFGKGADKGVDGILPIKIPDPKEATGFSVIRVLIQVKGGEHTKSGDIRDLKGSMEREKARFGIFITLEEPTKPMNEEAVSAGFESTPLGGEKIPRIQILTIKELIEDKAKPKVLQAYMLYDAYKSAELSKKEHSERGAKLTKEKAKEDAKSNKTF